MFTELWEGRRGCAAALYPEGAWDAGIVSSRRRPVTNSAMLIFLLRNMSNIPTAAVLGLL